MTGATAPRQPRPLPGLLLTQPQPEPKREPASLPHTPALIVDDGEDDWQDVYDTRLALAVASPVPRDDEGYVYIDSDDDLAQAGHEYPQDDGVEVEEEEDADEYVPQLQHEILAMRPATQMKPVNAAPYQPVTTIPSRSPSPALAVANRAPYVGGGHHNRSRHKARKSKPSSKVDQDVQHMQTAIEHVQKLAVPSDTLSSARPGFEKQGSKTSPEDEEDSLFVEDESGLGDLPSSFRKGPQYNQRKLDPNGERPPTVCFEEYPSNALIHVLQCGHQYLTKVPLACNRSCRLSDTAVTMTKGPDTFACKIKKCVQEEKKRNVMFNRDYKGGDIRIRKPTKPQTNTAYYAERLARSLKIDSNDKLFSMPEEERRKKQFGHAELSNPKMKKEPPHSYGSNIRRQQLFEYSMPAGMQAEMEAEEGNVIQESVADGRARARLNRNRDGYYEAEDLSEQDVGDDHAEQAINVAPDLHCRCQSESDGYLVQCTACGDFFHPKCVNKGNFGQEEYEGEHGHLALQADLDQFRGDNKDFLCMACDSIFKSVLAQSILSTKDVRRIRQEGKIEAYERAAERLRHHTEPAHNYQVALKKANGDPMAIQAAKDKYAAEVEEETRLDQELLGGSDDDDTEAQKTLRFSTRQQEKNKGVVLEKVIGKEADIHKPRKTKTRRGLNAVANTILAKNTTTAAAVKSLCAKPNLNQSTVTCDFCGTTIFGVFYKCKDCTTPDFSCCEECAQSGKSHVHSGHIFEAKHAREVSESEPRSQEGGEQTSNQMGEPTGGFKRPRTRAVPVAGIRRSTRSAAKRDGDGDVSMKDV